MSKRLKSIPKFANEAVERAFWEKHDSTEYLDWKEAQPKVFPKLKPGVSGILCVTAQRCDDHRPAGSMLPAGRRRLRYTSYTGTSVKRSAYRMANWFMACFQS